MLPTYTLSSPRDSATFSPGNIVVVLNNRHHTIVPFTTQNALPFVLPAYTYPSLDTIPVVIVPNDDAYRHDTPTVDPDGPVAPDRPL
jgi:hypothetical protein